MNSGPDATGIGELVARLVREARLWIRAELRFYRKLGIARLDDVKMAAAFGAGGATLGMCALIALLVGLIIALTPVVGIVWAIVIVVGITLALSALLIRACVRSFKSAVRKRVRRKDL